MKACHQPLPYGDADDDLSFRPSVIPSICPSAVRPFVYEVRSGSDIDQLLNSSFIIVRPNKEIFPKCSKKCMKIGFARPFTRPSVRHIRRG